VEESGQEISRRLANEEREAAIARGETPADPNKNPAFLAARARLAYDVDAQKADGDVILQLALSRKRAEQRQTKP
jgi:hypothetical protein